VQGIEHDGRNERREICVAHFTFCGRPCESATELEHDNTRTPHITRSRTTETNIIQVHIKAV
jgi:hypothetical protein